MTKLTGLITWLAVRHRTARTDDSGFGTLEWVILAAGLGGAAVAAILFLDGRLDTWLEKIPI